MFGPPRHPSARGHGAHMPMPHQTHSQGPGSSTYQLPHDLIPKPLRWLHRMSRSRRVSSSHKSNSCIYRSSTMNRRHRAECSLNLSSRPHLRNPLLNPHLDSLSTPDWLQLLSPSPCPCAAPAVLSRRLSTNSMFTRPWWELLQHLRKTLQL